MKRLQKFTIRFRSQAEFEKIKRAAKLEDLSLNKFIVGRASVAASEVLDARKSTSGPENPQAEVA